MRSFVAVEIPEEERSRLSAFMRSMPAGLPLKWTDPRGLHVTLKFLGSVADSDAERIAPALRRAAGSVARFSAALGGVGAFPDLRQPRVVWAGVETGAEELGVLAEKVGSELAALDYPGSEKPFSPHVTLGRSKDDKELKRISEAVRGAKLETGASFPVEKIALFKSTTLPTGPVYEKIAEAPLA